MELESRRGFSRVNEINARVVGPKNGSAPGGVMTGVAVITSDRVLASGVGAGGCLSFQNAFTGTPTGAFTYEGSNDNDPDSAPVCGWIAQTPTVAGANPAGAAGGSVSVFVNPPMRWYRQKYTNSGGAGVLNTMAEAKGA